MCLQCFQWNSHAKEPLVERSGKESIQQVLMDQSQAQDTATEPEPDTIQTRKIYLLITVVQTLG